MKDTKTLVEMLVASVASNTNIFQFPVISVTAKRKHHLCGFTVQLNYLLPPASSQTIKTTLI